MSMAAAPLPIRQAAPVVDVVCAGHATARGEAQGRVLREAIVGASETIQRLEAFRLTRPWWLPERWHLRLADHRACAALRGGLSHAAPVAWQRLEAMSRASGVSLARLALLNALEPVLADLSGSTTTGAESGCSAIAVGAERTGGLGPILAHNFDYLPLVQPFYAVRDERPSDGLRALQFFVAPQAGMVDGINAAGLAATYNYAYTTDLGPPGPTLSMRLADVLATCRTVAEAVHSLTTKPRWGSGLVMLADADGAIASVELSSSRWAVRTGRPAETLTHANQFRDAATCPVQIAAAAVHHDRAPQPLRGRRVHQSSEARDRRLATRPDDTRVLDPPAIARLMADHGPQGQPSADTICMHSDYWHTTACVQLLPQARMMRIAYAPACAATYAELTCAE